MTPEQLRRLADLIDDLEEDSYQVEDAELLPYRDGGAVAAVELSLPESDEEATLSFPGATTANGTSAFPGGVPVDDGNAVTEADVVGSPEEDDADELEDEAESSDGDQTVELTDAEQDVAGVLEDEGELPSSEIERISERSGQVSNILPRLRDKGVLEYRKDPDDGRRYLYSLARDDVVDEDTGGGHELPDASNIGTGEMTSAVRPLDEGEWAPSELEQRGQEDTDMIQASGFAGDDDEVDDDLITFPWECSCGVVCEGKLEREVHRTEAHGVPQKRLNSLEQGEFVDLVRKADSVTGLAESLNYQTHKTLRILGIYGFENAVAGDGLPNDPTATTDLLQLGDEAGSDERQQAETEVSPDA
jgi:hypothetical protein